MKHFLKCLIVLICLIFTQCQSHSQSKAWDLKLDCLSDAENEYLGQLFAIFEEKLMDRYWEKEIHELMYQYVNDFHANAYKFYPHLFRVFKMDTTPEEFHKIFIKNSQILNAEDFLLFVGNNDQEDEDERYRDYYVINSNSIYLSCFLQQKSKHEDINSALHTLFTIQDIAPNIIAGGMEIFKKNDFKDPLLQLCVLFHLFLLPNLYLQDM